MGQHWRFHGGKTETFLVEKYVRCTVGKTRSLDWAKNVVGFTGGKTEAFPDTKCVRFNVGKTEALLGKK